MTKPNLLVSLFHHLFFINLMISNFRIPKLCMRKSIINLILPEAQSFCTLRNLIWFWSLKAFSNLLFYFCKSSNNQFCHHFGLQILGSLFIFNFAYKNGQFFSEFIFFLYCFSNGKSESQYVDVYRIKFSLFAFQVSLKTTALPNVLQHIGLHLSSPYY